MDIMTRTLLIGIGATALTDVWGLARQLMFGIAQPNYRLVGRWIGHMPRGQFRHQAIAQSAAVPGERLIGWTSHYLIGISFASLLIMIGGDAWLQSPTLPPALTTGLLTVAAPFLLMQPGMGAGLAASRTPQPNAARLHSLITHGIFGLGLYVAARALNTL